MAERPAKEMRLMPRTAPVEFWKPRGRSISRKEKWASVSNTGKVPWVWLQEIDFSRIGQSEARLEDSKWRWLF